MLYLIIHVFGRAGGKGVKDVSGRPSTHVGVGSARQKTLNCPWCGCQAAVINLDRTENWTAVSSLYNWNMDNSIEIKLITMNGKL